MEQRWNNVAQGGLGAGHILVNLLTPFLRPLRSHWGLTRAEARRHHPGDEYIREPTWQWTHATEIDAPPEAVWPWLVQVGQDKAGFYSYQFLENLAGSRIQNASCVHAEWQALKVGDALRLHRFTPPLRIAAVESGRLLVAFSSIDPRTGKDLLQAGASTGSYVAVSWALLLEPRPHGRTRLLSRFRTKCSSDLTTRVLNGPYLMEAIGFAMDRGMLNGIKRRVERTRRAAHT